MTHPAELSLLLHRALDPRLGRLLELTGMEGWQADPESLHQVRIASRRVRAVLDLADPQVYPGFKRHRRHVRGLTRALGITRELDVHAAQLEALRERHLDPFHGASIDHLLELLERKRQRAREAMAHDLDRITLKDLDRMLPMPDFQDPVVLPALPQAAWTCLEPWIQAVEELLPPLLEREDAAGMHQLRIKVKRLRYTLEILEPAFPAPLEDTLQHLKALQTALGLHHDLSMLEAYLWPVHAALASRQRVDLAAGILDILATIAEERRGHFERFQALGRAHRDSVLYFQLKQALDRAAGPAE